MRVSYRYAEDDNQELEAKPFDEPSVSDEMIGLDRGLEVDDVKKNSSAAASVPPPPLKSVFASKTGYSSSSSNSQQQKSRRNEFQQREKRRQRLSEQIQKERRVAKKKLLLPKMSKKKKSKQKEGAGQRRRISFADELVVDVVPEEIGGVQTTDVSVASSRPEGVAAGGAAAAGDDRSYQSFLSFENSLEYFLRGEWIKEEVDLILSPVQCKPKLNKKNGASSDKEEKNRFCGIIDPSDYTSKPFSVPFKWKEYTSLDSECFDADNLCRNSDEVWVDSDHVPRQQRSSRRSLCSEDDDAEENDSLTTARLSVSNSFREMLPPLKSIQRILGGFLEESCGKTNKKEKRERMKRTNSDDTMSMSAASAHHCSDSEDSTLANMLRSNATAE
ncbi:MAG: hypothetical protein SGILL_005491 [Bacillariaceae sp.]